MLRTVRTENGWVKGTVSDPRITAFKGIPLVSSGKSNQMESTAAPEDQMEFVNAIAFAPISMQSIPESVITCISVSM